MSESPQLETDPRFPSGKWVGFWIQKHPPLGRHPTELFLTFADGLLHGEGRDIVGQYTVKGRYDLADGRCHWVKHYVGKHDVYYDGFNEGKGIWGTWMIRESALSIKLHGGFHIWPEEMPDPTERTLKEEADVPAEPVLV
jgi:hypothetical protein